MVRYIGLIAILLVLMGFSASPLSTFSVMVNNAEVILNWNVNDLSQVQKFEVYRKWEHNRSGKNEFVKLDDSELTITAAIRRNPPPYFEYIDNQLFKGENGNDVEYVLYIYMTDGTRYEAHRHVQYTTSAVRRTWGSIKSMFQ
ncbi:MAG: hypothetical protein JJU41_12730 [Bacteroidetes bacterium]|nr:hypothetical protein [Bacteroidota bacterium]